jgi:aspartyl-tRNA(Asn)/glutamyl-tRNA(Gln) amidotransferase subunit B
MSGIDLNRAGTPLLEIVSEPDMRSSAEAVAYARALHALVRWIDVCDGNMQEGSFRCDANVSVRRLGATAYGTRCEIKNLNSFRFLERAIDHEVERQIDLIESGGHVVQETRLYDPDRDETRAMRSKEDAQDYRYFPDPDLLPLEIDPAWIERVRAALPELPAVRRERFVTTLGLSPYDAATLTASREIAAYFEAVVDALPAQPKLAANWVMGDLAARLNREDLDIAASPVGPAQLASLLARIADGTLSGKLAKEVFDALWAGEGESVDAIVAARGLVQISDAGALDALIAEVMAANAKSVDEYRSGKEKAFNALVGQVMKASKGRANPAQVNERLKAALAG